MATERLRESIDFNTGDRLFIMYGNGVQDKFITEDYIELNFEQALWHLLKERGYERIVYFSAIRSVYFLDENSRKLSLPKIDDQDDEDKSEEKASFSGPLGKRMLISGSNQKASTSSSSSRPSPMRDVHSLGLLNTLMFEEDGPQTAIVFVQAAHTLESFDDVRLLGGWIGEWANMVSTNKSKCLFVYSSPNFEGLSQERIDVLRSIISLGNDRRKSNVVNIGPPEAAEIQRLVDFVRIRDGVVVKFTDQEQLSTWMGVEGVLAKQWLSDFRNTKRFDIETARVNGWLESMPSDLRPPQEKLNELIGLEDVKQHINTSKSHMLILKERAESGKGKNAEPPLMHMVFYGNPGTGKTIVARLIGELYRDIGLLKRGHLIEPKVDELIAGYVGQTAIQTNTIVDRALDGILFIDEAYQLTEDDFGRQAIDALVARLENDRHRLLVIFAGYKKEMEEFIGANPGLSRRLPPDNRIEFPDYSPDELYKILMLMAEHEDVALSPEMQLQIQEVIQGMYNSKDEEFGNAGDMRNLVKSLHRKRSVRITENNLDLDELIRPEDFSKIYQQYLTPPVPEIDDVLKELNELVGLNKIKDFVRMQIAQIKLQKHRIAQGHQLNPRSLHMVYLGNPGTGKTTVAKLMGRIFKTLGILRKGHVVVASSADLIAQYVRQTGPKTREKIKEALDGILFIDEAYDLTKGNENSQDFGKEAIAELIQGMENYRDRLIVIVAGYPAKMQTFIDSNEGIRSRFIEYVKFEDYSSNELIEILHRMGQSEGYGLSSTAVEAARIYLENLRKKRKASFGNAREVRNLLQKMTDRLALRLAESGDFGAEGETLEIVVEDVPTQ
jgi:SpoVK/Ycf46/Vps4 family AAA+-type ATPase